MRSEKENGYLWAAEVSAELDKDQTELVNYLVQEVIQQLWCWNSVRICNM